MDKTRQRIAVCGLLGWRIERRYGVESLINPQGHQLWAYDRRGNSYGPCTSWDSALRKGSHFEPLVPNYPEDLNAMRNALGMVCRERKAREFGHALFFVVDRDTASEDCSISDCIDDPVEILGIVASSANAAQFCEAFLRTFDKWEGT